MNTQELMAAAAAGDAVRLVDGVAALGDAQRWALVDVALQGLGRALEGAGSGPERNGLAVRYAVVVDLIAPGGGSIFEACRDRV